MGKLCIKPWAVSVGEFGTYTYHARSRGKALADAWRSNAFEGWTFKEFLSRANARVTFGHPRFGEEITVGGERAFLITLDRQYIHFVRPGDDRVLLSHPLDVEPPEARRGTPYYEAPKATAGGDL